MTNSADANVLIRREGTAGRVTLNRPKALNSLTLGMVREIVPALRAWASDPAVELVLVDGAGDKALCAGGDVRWLYDSRGDGSKDARTFWREEYALDALIGRYPKPYVAFMDGIVMGGGIGLSAHGRHRIVTERSQLAMPETSIGLVPDVGGSWLLARAPGEVGVYLGLIGERMRGAGTIYAGFADSFVPSARLGELAAALCEAKGSEVAQVIARFAEPPPASELAGHRAAIDRTFGFDTVAAIRDALGREGGAWAEKTLKSFDERSPLCLSIALAAIRKARTLGSLEQALQMEFRICTHLFEHGEFVEGVRALIVDKDRKPRWNPTRIEEVTPAMVARFLGPLADGDEVGLV
jgi:enoyl-CoA hydratase